MNWICLIPLRAGSKSVPNKNIRSVSGKPLYRYTVDYALDSGASHTYISTNIKEILALPKEKNITITKRNDNLCADDTPMSAVILDFLKSSEGVKIGKEQTIVLLQATSPLRQKKDLLNALKRFENAKMMDLMMAVTKAENHALKYGYVTNGTFNHISDPNLCFENRQKLPKLFKPTGTFYIFKAGWYLKNKTLATYSTGAYEIPQDQSLDIDTVADLKLFEDILKKRRT
tara:strand:+ start:271 stop:960 length:690 start_codon:yes stop_codon:yes gene_type:complete